MGKTKDFDDISRRPARTSDEQEKRNINLAARLAEQQLRDGTASPSVIVHYLKLGSPEERLNLEILERQRDLIAAKTDAYKSSSDINELYAKAIAAFTEYEADTEYEIE